MTNKITDVTRAFAYLLRVAEPPAPAVHAFVVARGALEAVERIRSRAAPDAVMAEAFRRDSGIDSPTVLAGDIAAIESGAAQLITPDSPEWPTGLFTSLRPDTVGRHVPPLALWVRGNTSLAELTQRAVSMVGARAATGYGEHVAADLSHGLAGEGIAVISGAAYGIDGAAHRGALAAAGVTVAVLGCGVDVGYPSGHADLLDRIAGSGLVISEYPPGTPPARHRFLVRNRLIAALGTSTVIVESGIRSGSQNTAATAHTIGRRLLAVPGPITSVMSAGTNELLRAGIATAVTSVAEVIESSKLNPTEVEQ